jgi:hypothetical protein
MHAVPVQVFYSRQFVSIRGWFSLGSLRSFVGYSEFWVKQISPLLTMSSSAGAHQPLTSSDRTRDELPVVGWRIECRVFKEATSDQSTPSAGLESSSEIVLKNPVTQIGRSSKKRNLQPEIACDWDGAVSHRHAKIELDPDGNAFLVDLGSTNGTMLNGQLISANNPVKLKDGDRISLGGKTALIIHEPTAVKADVKGEK